MVATRGPWRSCRLDRGHRLPVGTAAQGRGARGLGKEGFLEEVTVSRASQDEEGSSTRSRMCSDATRSRVAVSAAGVGTEQSARQEWTGVDAAGPRSPGRAVLWPCPQGLRGRHLPSAAGHLHLRSLWGQQSATVPRQAPCHPPCWEGDRLLAEACAPETAKSS